MSKYYRYRQNNSGGAFEGPAIDVFVEADTPEEADEIAQTKGIYFDPEYRIDCDCCGNRWSNAMEWDAYAEVPEPSTYALSNLLYDGYTRQLVVTKENN